MGAHCTTVRRCCGAWGASRRQTRTVSARSSSTPAPSPRDNWRVVRQSIATQRRVSGAACGHGSTQSCPAPPPPTSSPPSHLIGSGCALVDGHLLPCGRSDHGRTMCPEDPGTRARQTHAARINRCLSSGAAAHHPSFTLGVTSQLSNRALDSTRITANTHLFIEVLNYLRRECR
eukprot:COSAG01_NODE_2052_length_8544_cov_8.628034_4_plen_175_part_00